MAVEGVGISDNGVQSGLLHHIHSTVPRSILSCTGLRSHNTRQDRDHINSHQAGMNEFMSFIIVIIRSSVVHRKLSPEIIKTPKVSDDMSIFLAFLKLTL